MRMFSKIIGLVLSMTLMTQLAAAQDGGATGDRISKKPPVFHTISGVSTLTYQSGQEFKTDSEFTMAYTGLEYTGIRRQSYIAESVTLRYQFGGQNSVTFVGHRSLGRSISGDEDRTNYEVVLNAPLEQGENLNGSKKLTQTRLRYSIDRITLMPIWSTAVFEVVVYNPDAVNPVGFVGQSLPLQPK